MVTSYLLVQCLSLPRDHEVNIFLELMSGRFLASRCLLLVVQPVEIGGRNVEDDFEVGLKYEPPIM